MSKLTCFTDGPPIKLTEAVIGSPDKVLVVIHLVLQSSLTHLRTRLVHRIVGEEPTVKVSPAVVLALLGVGRGGGVEEAVVGVVGAVVGASLFPSL